MGAPALKHLSITGNPTFELSTIQLGSDDLSESLRRHRAGVTHERFGVTIASRTWKQARIWNLNLNAASIDYIESLREYFEAGSFYLYPDIDNVAVKYTVFWQEDEFNPAYVAPGKYSLRATFKETTIGAGTPAYLTSAGSQAVAGALSVGGSLTVAGTFNGSVLLSGGTNLASMFSYTGHNHSGDALAPATVAATTYVAAPGIRIGAAGSTSAVIAFVNGPTGTTAATIGYYSATSSILVSGPVQFGALTATTIQASNLFTQGVASANTLDTVGRIECAAWVRAQGSLYGNRLYLNHVPTTATTYIQFSGATPDVAAPSIGYVASASSFSINKALEATSWLRTPNDVLSRHLYLDQKATEGYAYIQFSGSSATATTLPRLAYSSTTNAFSFNRGIKATTFSGNVVSENISNSYAATLTAATSVGVTGIANEHRFNNTAAFQSDSSVSYGMQSKFAYTAGTNAVMVGGYVGYDSAINLTNSGALVTSPNIYAFKSAIDAGGVTIGSSPIAFTMTNASTAQSWTNGYLQVDVYGNAGGNMIAAVTKIRANGTGDALGYQGYATPSSGTHTGALIGVQGIAAFGTVNATHRYAAALDGVCYGNSSGTPTMRKMGVRSNAHLLVYNGSIIAASGSSVESPASLTGVTNHVNFSGGAGELYVQGVAEFDAEVFFDGNESHSYTGVAGNYTAAKYSVIIVDATAADRTITLPAATSCAGRQYTIKKTSGTTYKATVNGGGTNIDGAATVDITTSYGYRTVISNGTQWFIVAAG